MNKYMFPLVIESFYFLYKCYSIIYQRLMMSITLDILKDAHMVFVATHKLMGSFYQENEPMDWSLLEINLPSL